MKKYGICFSLFVLIGVICLSGGYLLARNRFRNMQEPLPQVVQSQIEIEQQPVVNQEQVKPLQESSKEQYYLVSEDGYLLVLYEDMKSICLYTHIPITDFPEEQRAKLMEGIWFSSMVEVFNYLESYTS